MFPHDAIHLLVEKQLVFQMGFWGRISSGASPVELAEIAKSGGHASASRAGNSRR